MLIIFAFVNSYAKIEKDEILGLWLFDDGKGNALKDSSGNDNHSKLIDGPKWVAGQFGKALAFDAAEKQRVEVDNSKTLNPTKQISILAWEYLEDKGGNRRFLQKSASGGDNQYRLLLEWGNFRFDAGPGVTPNTVDVPIFSEKKWHHVAGIYDGKEITLYIDGNKEGSKPAKGDMVPSDGPIFLGTKWAEAPNGDYWNGKIDEVAVLSRGITQAEVKEVMKGFDKIFVVDSTGKIAITWGNVKTDYH